MCVSYRRGREALGAKLSVVIIQMLCREFVDRYHAKLWNDPLPRPPFIIANGLGLQAFMSTKSEPFDQELLESRIADRILFSVGLRDHRIQ